MAASLYKSACETSQRFLHSFDANRTEPTTIVSDRRHPPAAGPQQPLPYPPEQMWYRSPLLHVVETALLFVLVFVSLQWTFPAMLREVLQPAEESANNENGLPPATEPSRFDLLIGSLFVFCWLSIGQQKLGRPKPHIQIFWLLMPCHVMTLLWPVVLYSLPALHVASQQKQQLEANDSSSLFFGFSAAAWQRYLGTFLVATSWGPMGAFMMPDFSDYRNPRFEIPLFFLHHGLLVLTPFYYAFFLCTDSSSSNYRILAPSLSLLVHLTAILVALHLIINAIIADFIGLNIIYQLFPPKWLGKVPGLRSLGPYYRLPTVIVLSLLTFGMQSLLSTSTSI